MKLRNKLILSCAALAAVATTAVSTTYAWYTSNTNVTASNIAASSDSSGDDLLLIADGITRSGTETYTYAETAFANLNWGTSIANVTMTNNKLLPLAYNSVGKALVDAKTDPTSATESTETSWSSSAAKYVTFELYFKNASGTDKALYINGLTLTNQTATLPVKTVINPSTNYSNLGFGSAAAATTYTIDALRALQFDVETYSVSNGTAADTTTAENVFDPEGLVSLKADTISANSTSAYNAHTYYNNVMETPLTVTTDKTVKTALTTSGTSYLVLGTVPSAATAATMNNALKVVFKVFLNGWDLACYDACQGQDFKLDLSFTVVEPTAEGASTSTYIKTVSA